MISATDHTGLTVFHMSFTAAESYEGFMRKMQTLSLYR